VIVIGVLALASAWGAGVPGRVPEAADLVLLGGKIVTMNPRQPQAEAIAIIGSRIARVGSAREIEAMIGPGTRVIPLNGRLVVPGFIESHGHLLGLGQSRLLLDLRGTKSAEEVAERVAQRVREAQPGEWILGRGWDQNAWPTREFPTHDVLDRVAPHHPVYLTRVDGHAAWVNRRALELAGITRETADPPGGRLLRDAQGRPTGVLIDRAMALVAAHIPPRRHEENTRAVLLAMDECLRFGITSFHDAGASREAIRVYKELLREGKLTLRLYVMISGRDEALLREALQRGPEIGLGDHRLTIRAIKLVADGALGSRGAALLEPYADEPGHSGLLLLSEEEISRIARQALAAGFQVATHAIGDRANRVVLNAYERAFREFPSATDPRFRIEHAQILDEADIPRFARLGVIASMQAIHATSDMPWVPSRIGEARAREGAYVWRKLLASGARIANGSDAPVEPVNPLLGFYAAITRQDAQGNPPGGWYPDQRMTREEALRSFTVDAAYAAFEEHLKGSLEPGKVADLVVLSRDILTIPPPEILRTEVDLTIVGGRIVYERSSARP
jgi:predicted amidohydrolase YtcJ